MQTLLYLCCSGYHHNQISNRRRKHPLVASFILLQLQETFLVLLRFKYKMPDTLTKFFLLMREKFTYDQKFTYDLS